MVITTADSNSIRTLTFNRPEALNAFNDLMRDEVTSAILNAAADDTVKILVITGTGRAFSAGMDLNPGDDAYESRYSLADMFDAFLDFPKLFHEICYHVFDHAFLYYHLKKIE